MRCCGCTLVVRAQREVFPTTFRLSCAAGASAMQARVGWTGAGSCSGRVTSDSTPGSASTPVTINRAPIFSPEFGPIRYPARGHGGPFTHTTSASVVHSSVVSTFVTDSNGIRNMVMDATAVECRQVTSNYIPVADEGRLSEFNFIHR